LKAENKCVYEVTGGKIRKSIEGGLSEEGAIAKGIEDQSKEFNLLKRKTDI